MSKEKSAPKLSMPWLMPPDPCQLSSKELNIDRPVRAAVHQTDYLYLDDKAISQCVKKMIAVCNLADELLIRIHHELSVPLELIDITWLSPEATPTEAFTSAANCDLVKVVIRRYDGSHVQI